MDSSECCLPSFVPSFPPRLRSVLPVIGGITVGCVDCRRGRKRILSVAALPFEHHILVVIISSASAAAARPISVGGARTDVLLYGRRRTGCLFVAILAAAFGIGRIVSGIASVACLVTVGIAARVVVAGWAGCAGSGFAVTVASLVSTSAAARTRVATATVFAIIAATSTRWSPVIVGVTRRSSTRRRRAAASGRTRASGSAIEAPVCGWSVLRSR